MVITTYIYVKSSYAYEVVKANQKRVENVFENMIYSPILCKKKKTNCAKYEIKATEVYATGLGSSEIDILKKKINEDNKIEFVAYNDNAKKFMRVFKATLP